MDAWHLVAERKIQEAMEEGAFENLAGAGKPLELSGSPFEDPSERMANRLLRNNGFAPGWIEDARELEAEFRRLQTRGADAKPDYRSRVASLNRKILLFNLKTPAATLHKRLIETDT